MELQKLIEQVGPDWALLLEPFMVDKNSTEAPYSKISTFLKTEKDNGRIFFPAGKHVFRAFRETPLTNVRVVIVGQDPYPKAGFANGLAFATDTTNLPTSLNVLYDALEQDAFNGLDLTKPQRTGDLSSWTRQGVLLLNTALTVSEDKAGSHQEIWAPFTEFLVSALTDVKRDLVWIAMGAPARKAVEKVNPFRSFVYLCEHPAFAARNKRHMEHNRVFTKTNQAIKLNNLGEQIKW